MWEREIALRIFCSFVYFFFLFPALYFCDGILFVFFFLVVEVRSNARRLMPRDR
jgi:hypothetical protein